MELPLQGIWIRGGNMLKSLAKKNTGLLPQTGVLIGKSGSVKRQT
jgi:hypothetical protein